MYKIVESSIILSEVVKLNDLDVFVVENPTEDVEVTNNVIVEMKQTSRKTYLVTVGKIAIAKTKEGKEKFKYIVGFNAGDFNYDIEALETYDKEEATKIYNLYLETIKGFNR